MAHKQQAPPRHTPHHHRLIHLHPHHEIAPHASLPLPQIELQPLLPQHHLESHTHIAAGPSFLASSESASFQPVDHHPNEGTTEQLRSQLLPRLYTSHFLSRWGDRMWEFAVGLFMFEIWRDSLLFTSLYGLVESAFVAAVGTVIGGLVDKSPRLKVVQISLGVQNGSVLVAALALIIPLLHPGSMPGGFKVFISVMIMINVLGGIAALAAVATNISIERDWVVVIAAGKSSEALTIMNAMMRRIDLSCKLLAPVVVGLLMSSVSVLAAAVLIATWNTISVGFEYWLLLSVYSETPALHERTLCYHPKKSERASVRAKGDSLIHEYDGKSRCDEIHDDHLLSLEENTNKPHWLTAGVLKKILHLPFFDGWRIYLHQEMVLAAASLAMLYLTVLSFGSLMTAVLSWRGVPTFVLGLARGVSALVGICATIAYPVLHSRLQTIQTGLWSILLQWAFLLLCGTSVWVHNTRISSALLMGGVVASRLGLWMFDLSVTQLMQESVPEAERGVVGGVQNSLQSLLQMFTYLLAMFFPHPKDFDKLVLISCAFATIALILYAIQVYRVSGHLFRPC